MLHSDLSVPRAESHKGVKCLSTNTDCLPNKLIELENFLNFESIDIACIVETIPKKCPSEEIRKLKFDIPGYQCINNTIGRGVCMYVNNKFEIIERLHEFESLFQPSIFCRVKTNLSSSCVIGTVYRTPSSSEIENKNFINQFDIVSSKFLNVGEKLLLVGDLNCPGINWAAGTCSKSPDSVDARLLNSVQQHFLTQFVNKTTHHRGEKQKQPLLT